jgi:hypothetical protein
MFYWCDLLFFFVEKDYREEVRGFQERKYLACDLLGYETEWSITKLYDIIKLYSTNFQYALILCTLKIDTWDDPNRQKSVNFSFNKSNKFFSVKLFSIHIFKSPLIFQGRCIYLDYLTELLTTQKLKVDPISSLCVIHWVSESENRIA